MWNGGEEKKRLTGGFTPRRRNKEEKNPREQLGLDGVIGHSCLDHAGGSVCVAKSG